MLKKTRTLIICISSIIIIMLYVDNLKYYQGDGYGLITKTLPFNLKPVYWGWDLGNFGFRIEDKYGISVIAYKSIIQTKNASVEINKILEYGFNENQLVSLIQDSSNHTLCVSLIPSTKKASENFRFQVYKNETFLRKLDKSNFKWVKLDNNSSTVRIYNITFNYLLIALGLFIIFLIRRLFLNVISFRNFK